MKKLTNIFELKEIYIKEYASQLIILDIQISIDEDIIRMLEYKINSTKKLNIDKNKSYKNNEKVAYNNTRKKILDQFNVDIDNDDIKILMEL